MATFRCTIVTPSDSLLDEQVTYATFQAWDGQKGVAPGASAFLAKLGTGAARLDLASGQSRWFVIDGGFAQMQGDALTLLVDGAAVQTSPWGRFLCTLALLAQGTHVVVRVN